MTKDKTNDFIKIKVVKDYCKKNNKSISNEQITAMKEATKLYLEQLKTIEQKKQDFVKETIEEPKL